MPDYSTVEATTYDLIVIGGGINGVAVARDAALRGLKTILIEKGDFGGGTTSWSSRLIHGGLRYLEYFEFNLVRESLREREILLKTAPHLVKPIQMTIPIYAQGSRSYWEIQAGMVLYDLLSYDKSLPNHRMLGGRKMRQLFRDVEPEGCRGAAQYYDAQVEYAERLCLEIVLSAQDAGATMLSYVTVTQLQRQGNRISSLVCRDSETAEAFTVHGHDQTVVINTSGPWVDQICRRGIRGNAPAPVGKTRKIGGTRGSHIIVEKFPGAPDEALYVEALTDGRPFFILPWLGMCLIGTTDIRFDGDLDQVHASNDEIDYLLNETNRVIPKAQLTRELVRFTYAGIRPLPYSEGKKTSSITRSHVLYDHTSEGVENMVSLIGGKLTTHRQVGEEMVDAVLFKRLKKRGHSHSVTRKALLPGAMAMNAVRDMMTTANRDVMAHLLSVYGARTPQVWAIVEELPELAEPIVVGQPDIKAQIVYSVRVELARTYVDICRRRTAMAMRGNYGFDALPVMAAVLKRYCGWSGERCDRNLLDYYTYMRDHCIPEYQLDQYQPPVAATVA
ncbi:glycerol-3-phosphate dehydrogenase/oxidase [Leptothoe sp. PORK10 BA2]|uniref:glycerol-3-phosphate dehydrogenase/oxidase n=1 Tax=Leptothoe sp. PORK10 BA2 TaxID=3110254 RepID=UPI002B20B906|nr:glycerol-3-phosphate dehydrogenase/oxidase [Leptothoe sp. PORK10 BA2]MEA5463200.1 glycerol-3-phosphate dehydrogenase/oxidase [Leptothoe sp. PORK10 BA2]